MHRPLIKIGVMGSASTSITSPLILAYLNLSQLMREEHMPAKRLAMRQIQEVLRLKWGQGLSQRQIAQSLGISRPALAEYLHRAEQAGLSWPLPEVLDDNALEQLLFPARPMISAYKT